MELSFCSGWRCYALSGPATVNCHCSGPARVPVTQPCRVGILSAARAGGIFILTSAQRRRPRKIDEDRDKSKGLIALTSSSLKSSFSFLSSTKLLLQGCFECFKRPFLPRASALALLTNCRNVSESEVPIHSTERLLGVFTWRYSF